MASEISKLRTDLATARADVARLRETLEGIVQQQPCLDNGGCFYPMHDGDGNYIGEQNVDPITVIKSMAQTAQETLAAITAPPLDAARADVVRLRKGIKAVQEWLSDFSEAIAATDAPPVVPLADAEALASALALFPAGTHARDALAAYRAKHPKP